MRRQFVSLSWARGTAIAAALFAVSAPPALADDYKVCAGSDPDKSIAACSRLISKGKHREDPTWPYFNRAGHYSNKGDYDRAIADYSKVIEINPKDAEAYIHRGGAYLNKGDYDRALVDTTKAIEFDPRRAPAYYNRGISYAAKGDYGRAIADHTKALEIDPKNGDGFNGRAYASYKLGKLEEAKADADRAVKLAPKDAAIADTRGSVLLGLGDADGAIAEFSRGIGLGAKYATTYAGRGQAHEKKAAKDLALADYRKALEQSADDDVQREAQSTARARIAALETPVPSTAAAAPVALTAAAASPPPAPILAAPPSGRRVALVIGNGAYSVAGRLQNALEDARAIATVLGRLGFEVVSVENLSSQHFGQTVADFAAKARGADVALFFYAGHALQLGHTNYLMPIDAKLANELDVKRETIAAQDIVELMEGAARMNLVFLDACRNNPLAEQLRTRLSSTGRGASIGRGLGRIETKGRDTLIVFSAEAGQEALDADGVGGHSPFATGLLANMETPGLEIEVMLKKVTKAVRDATGGKQQPERLSKLESEFYFKP